MLPLDWLIIENILNLDYAKGIEMETKAKLREAYSRIIREERHHRELMEKKIREVNPEGGATVVWEMMENRDQVAEDQY